MCVGKTHKNLSIINGILALIIVIQSNSGHGTPTVKLALENSNDFPYVIGDSEKILDPNPGLTIEMLNKIAQDLNITFEFQRFPWNRCLSMMEKGLYDGCFSASYKKEREKLGVYPKKSGHIDEAKRLMDSSYALYTRANSKPIWDKKKLLHPSPKKLKIVSLRGFSIKKFLESQGAEVYEVDKIVQALNMVREKRVDAAALIDLPADYVIKKNKLNLAIQVPPLKTKAYFLMFSHQFYSKNKDLAERIWKSLEEIRKSTYFENLKEKYFSLNH